MKRTLFLLASAMLMAGCAESLDLSEPLTEVGAF
jgi:PBP1b-binding outer membrane lipoprotein LpoB